MSWLLKRQLDESESQLRQHETTGCLWWDMETEPAVFLCLDPTRTWSELWPCCIRTVSSWTDTTLTWFLLPVVTTGVSSHSLCLDSRWSVSLLYKTVLGFVLELCRSALCEPLNGSPPRVAAPSSCSSTWIQTESELMDNKRWSGLMDAGLQVARVGECDVGDLAQRGACRTLTAAHYTFRRMKGPEECNVAPDTRLCLLPAKTLCCLHSSGILISDWSISLVRRCLDSSGSAFVRVTAPCSVVNNWLRSSTRHIVGLIMIWLK